MHQSKIRMYGVTHYSMCAEKVNQKHRKSAFIAMPAILLAATVAVSFVVSEDAYARNGRYSVILVKQQLTMSV